jgi:hypothetical protein
MGGSPERLHGTTSDLLRTHSWLWLWCVPACAAIGASLLQARDVLSVPATGALWAAATLWIGLGCAVNARRCGRVHCLIDGVLFPLLAVSGLLNVLGIVTFSWNAYWAAFFVILLVSFIPEIVWKKYI